MGKAKFAAAIAVLSIVVYANSITGGFVSDDILGVIHSPQAGQLSACRDLTGLSKCLAYKIGGLNPVFYHFNNLFLHSINSILVFYFLLIFFKVEPSFFGALLFAVHPIHTEAVAWISGIVYLFLTAFLLSSFLLYRSATSGNKIKPGAYLLSLLLFIPPLTCWFTLFYPGMIILFDVIYNRWRKNWKLWLPYALISLAWVLSKIHVISQRVTVLQAGTGSATSMSNPVFNLVFSLFSHLKLLLWPINLTLYHEPLRISPSLLRLEIFSLVLILCLLPFLFKKAKPVFFALGIYTLFLFPTYSPVPISWVVAERYLYFPSISFSIVAAFLLQKYASAGKARILAVIFLIMLIGAYSARTVFRNKDWQSRGSLWRATVRVSPESPKAHNNMGDIYGGEGDLEKAAGAFKTAIALKPDYADAYHNLGNTCQNMGRINEAITNYQKAASLNPRLYQSYQNLGVIYFNQGKPVLAREYFQKALDINPDDIGLQKTLKKLSVIPNPHWNGGKNSKPALE